MEMHVDCTIGSHSATAVNFLFTLVYQDLLPSLPNNPCSQTGEIQDREVELKVGENSTKCPGSEDSYQS